MAMRSWRTLSNEAATRLVQLGRLRDLLCEMGCRPEEIRDGFRGTCPVCRIGRLTVFVNEQRVGRTVPGLVVGWGCSRRCQLWSHPDLLSLVKGYLGRTNEEAMSYVDNFLHTQPS